jgi:hypothetical protein
MSSVGARRNFQGTLKRDARSGGYERERATGGVSAVFPGQRAPLKYRRRG